MPSDRMMHHHQHKTAQHFMSQLLGLERMIKPRLNITLGSCIVLLILLLINNVHSLSTGAIPKAQVDMSQTLDNRTLGFIGCGTIACAIATGLLTQSQHPIEKIYVSRRSESKSRELAEKFPDKVVICDDNQAIVDKCDDLFLCVLPQQEEEVLKSLRIGKEKTLVSLVSTSKLESLIQNSGLAPENVFKMICLPAVATLEGTPLIVPRRDGHIYQLMTTLGGGTCIQCDTEEIMEAMMVPGCMMGPVYGLMKANRDFLVKKGVPMKDANHAVARNYWGITKDALGRLEESDDIFDALIEEQTPGGLNEQTLRNLSGAGFLESYDDAMEAVLSRIQGKSDGSLKQD